MNKILFSGIIISLSTLILSLVYQIALPYTYYSLIIIIAIFLASLTYRSNSKKHEYVIICIALICILLRSIYQISSRFTHIPLDDGYADYVTAKIYAEQERVSVLDIDTGPRDVSYVSGWPLIQLLAVFFSKISGLELLYVVEISPLIFSFGMFLFVYVMLRVIVKKLNLNKRVVALSLLFFSISPDNIYTSMQFIRQNLSLLFIIIMFYLLLKNIQTGYKNNQYKLLLIFFLLAQILSHCYSAFIMIIFFSLFMLLTYAANKVKNRFLMGFKITELPVNIGIVVLFSVSMFGWWLYYSPMVLTTYLPYLKWIRPSLSPYTGIEYEVARWQFYPSLRPQPYTDLLLLYYFFIYIPLIIGFLLYVKKVLTSKRIDLLTQYLIFSVSALFTIFLGLTLVLHVQPLRMLRIASPFIVLFTALFYEKLFSIKNIVFKMLPVFLIIITIVTTFIAPWSRGYIPIYVFDPSERFEDTGNHNPDYDKMVPFVKNHINYDVYAKILSDDSELLYIIVPTSNYYMLQSLYHNPEVINATNLVLFEYLNLNPRFQSIPYLYRLNPNLLEDIDDFKSQIEHNFNVIYDNRVSRIHVN